MSRYMILTMLAAAVLVAVLATVISAITADPPPPDPEVVPAADEPQDSGQDPLPPPIDSRANNEDQADPENDRDTDTRADDSARPRPAESTLTAVPLDGQDIADMLGLTMWRFDFDLIPDRYTIHLWVERWTPGADAPRVRHLVTESSSRWGRGEIVVKLPTESDGHLFARIDEVTTRAPDAQPITPPHPWRVAVADHKHIRYSQAMHLVTFTHNESERPTGGLRDVHRDHDVTVYIKARFIPGPFEPFRERSAEPEPEPEPESPAAPTPEPEPEPEADTEPDAAPEDVDDPIETD